MSGWKPPDAPLSPAIHTRLIEAHQRGARIATICAGVFALAQTGLLDGRRATTHWARAAELAARFPSCRSIRVSAGAGAGIDLCLHLVRSDHGAGHAAAVARHMVMPPHREGGQAQYAAVPAVPVAQDSLAVLLEWVTQRLDEPITVGDMAAVLQVSPRTLARRFAGQLRVSPGQWLLSQRINMTRALLEETDLPIDAIAVRVGLASATNLRRRFQHALRTTPAAYRRAFRQGQR